MNVPVIEDADIAWVCDILNLPDTAFSGTDGTDSRLAVIRSMDNLDIEACPGSGKTTLLVAKLAILARKWTESRRGLCVLSHTNVARREIDIRLGNTATGRRLLSYPHFLGTIHGFVNEYLALPWLRSLGYHVEMIDDEVSQSRRWRRLSKANQRALQNDRRHGPHLLKFCDAEFRLGKIPWAKGTLNENTPIYQAMQYACLESAREGFFCHDEMFVWANDMIDKMPGMAASLRMRFPFLFIDEAQDTSALQSTLLHRLLIDGDGTVTRQRLGDANQAVYQYAGQIENVGADAFPIAEIRMDIPNSFRFDESIADLAEPLAVEPQDLQGLRQPGEQKRHAIFLFDDVSIGFVLDRYAEYLTEVFTENELRDGSFTAVGAVHRPSNDGNMPHSVAHYWPSYDHEISRAEPQPKSFVQYLAAGRRLAQNSGEAHTLVDMVARGLLRLAKLANPNLELRRRKRSHRFVIELLEAHPKARKDYFDLVHVLCIERAPLTKAGWEGDCRNIVADISAAITGLDFDADAVEHFLAWDDTDGPGADDHTQRRSDNIFRYPCGNLTVEIRVGSIHSVKGETHTATLVLDTYYRAHHLKALKAWLTGAKSEGSGETPAMQSRLRLHYVAMSRPSHLLCLAMRDDVLSVADTKKVLERGWRIGKVSATGIDWKE